ncbi:MAG TPA: error-prone DNA polymerase [Hyphomicrobiaceae bacterium]|nr:error-prone DNA polymerase [Hyphomicrobiaceae bacterium]
MPHISENTPPARYAELQVTTNFSFLRGGSHPHELVAQAKALGLHALAITDRNTLAGVVRAHAAAKEVGLKLIVGARLDLTDNPSLLCLPRDRKAYGRLSRMLSLGQSRAEKGRCILSLADVAGHAEGQIFIALTSPPQNLTTHLHHLREVLSGARLYLAASHLYRGNDHARIAALACTAKACGTPVVATNDVLYHAPHRRPLQDVLTAIREKTTVGEAGFRLEANAERHLKPAREIARLFKTHEHALARTIEIADACRFTLDELVYEYPDEPVPPGRTPQSHLEELSWQGARWRFPDGIPARIESTLHKELALISQLNYAPYFLTVHDIVRFAQAQGILCQGRGSAANSAVCYCLGITAVNPVEVDLLFERFISPERKEPPDIDVDFEHERREEVIQYIYARYGRHRAGLAATVISYRPRSAIREVGKAMGLSEDSVSALAGTVWGSRLSTPAPDHNRAAANSAHSSDPAAYTVAANSARSSDPAAYAAAANSANNHITEAGFDPDDPLLQATLELTDELIGFPRHLSQHVGGFVLTRGPLVEVVPIGNAAMDNRTFIEWDKDDLETLGLLKVDVLALGMLSCIHRAFDLLEEYHGQTMTLANIPREDPAVYDMLCNADSVGVFQVESRAQMNMLPRLKPRCYYDLVIEVAIVRPGPIQGDMVHPYLRRRDGIEPERYPSPAPEHGPPDELRQILGKTKGVPLFQEQAMRIAMEAAKFSSAEVNDLRKAMATFRRKGTIGQLETKMVSRMTARGYDQDFAQRCFDQIKGFGEYGFPESHAASFAHLVYVSSWLKCHYPAVFCCAILNSQPMGFYAPAQLVRDAREHDVEVRPVDVNLSCWESTLEQGRENGRPAVRLGMRLVDGLRQDEALKILAARGGRAPHPPFNDAHDLLRRTGISRAALEKLASADAFRSMGHDRRQALWDVKGLTSSEQLPLFGWAATREDGPDPETTLPAMPLSEHVVCDYQTLRLSLKAHPLSFLRQRLSASRMKSCVDLAGLSNGAYVTLAGVILVRQRPGSAKGVVFMTIEDETGIANTVVWPKTLERYRKVVMTARLIVVRGRIQRHENIIHVVSSHLEDRSEWLALLSEGMTDNPAMAQVPSTNADEIARPGPASARPPSHPRWAGHPRNERVIPKSRDFH